MILTKENPSTEITQIHESLAALQTMSVAGRAGYLTQLAEIDGQAGRVNEGMALVAEAQTLLTQTGERVQEAELFRIQGELLHKRATTDVEAIEAEACFQRALDTARTQQAKSLELRAATSLGRLWHQQGKDQQTHALLNPVYAWFTEGLETADLQEAKTLLEAL